MRKFLLNLLLTQKEKYLIKEAAADEIGFCRLSQRKIDDLRSLSDLFPMSNLIMDPIFEFYRVKYENGEIQGR